MVSHWMISHYYYNNIFKILIYFINNYFIIHHFLYDLKAGMYFLYVLRACLIHVYHLIRDQKHKSCPFSVLCPPPIRLHTRLAACPSSSASLESRSWCCGSLLCSGNASSFSLLPLSVWSAIGVRVENHLHAHGRLNVYAYFP